MNPDLHGRLSAARRLDLSIDGKSCKSALTIDFELAGLLELNLSMFILQLVITFLRQRRHVCELNLRGVTTQKIDMRRSN